MNIPSEILQKHLRAAAEEAVERELRQQGFSVNRETTVGQFRADMVGERGEERVVVEFMTPLWSAADRDRVKQLRNYLVHEFSGRAQFKLVLVRPPRDSRIDVDDLEAALFDAIPDEPQYEDITEISAQARLDEVADLAVDSIRLGRNAAVVAGTATLGVEHRYGSSGDIARDFGATMGGSYPVDFEVELDRDLKVIEFLRLDIDVSSFYGE